MSFQQSGLFVSFIIPFHVISLLLDANNQQSCDLNDRKAAICETPSVLFVLYNPIFIFSS